MPRVHHPKTFDAAVRHLFRHLHDAQRLQTNPIVRHVLNATADAKESPRSSHRTLFRIHALIRQAAQQCCDEANSSEKLQRAHRQLSIITLQYFEGVPLETIARRLGISLKHCYRERAVICQRIALYLYQFSEPANVIMHDGESFYFLLDRLSEPSVCTPKALRACRYLEGIAQSPQQKIDALQTLIALSLNSGDYSSAEMDYVRATRLYDEHFATAPLELQRAAQVSINVAAWRLANYRGNHDQARKAAQSAVEDLEHLPSPQTPHAEEFWIDAHVNLAVSLWAAGDLTGGYDALSYAASHLNRLATSSPLRFRVEASLWKLRNYSLVAKPESYSAETRLEGLKAAFRRAHESGLLTEAIYTLIATLEFHVFARRDDEALQVARAALALVAKVDNSTTRMEAHINIGQRLLSTKFWPEALQLFPVEDRPRQIDEYHRRALAQAKALAALRLGDFQTAWKRSSTTDNDAWPITALRTQLVSAASAHKLGLSRLASETAERAVYAAESLGATLLLRDAYKVCAVIRGDKLLRRRAQELTRILVA